jgi:pimeloyl-ACP methyl ester carboxylesterase
MRVLRLFVAGLVALAVIAVAPDAVAVSSSCPATGTTDNPICFSWQGASWTETALGVPRLPGALLGPYKGEVFRPVGGSGSRPAIALLHGLSGTMQDVWWLARDLAGHGFVVITVTNDGSDADTFTNAMRAMEVYLKANAGALGIDLAKVGLAGHSAGARAASLVQSQTDILPVAAVVALDNLQSTEQGDAGSALVNPSCLGGTQTPIPPRVPGMGIAMDAPSYTCSSTDPDVKKTAWTKWRAAGQPSVEIVDKGANHFTFAQTATTEANDGVLLKVPAYFAQTWFERWLKDDTTATARLFDPTAVLGSTRDAYLSTAFRSAAYVPDRSVNCDSFAEADCTLS